MPVRPAVMVLGGLATRLTMLVQPIGQVLAWIACVFLTFTIAVVQFTASLPFASIAVGHFDAPILAAYYSALFGLTYVGWQTILAWRRPLARGVARVVGMRVWNLTLTASGGKTYLLFLDGG